MTATVPGRKLILDDIDDIRAYERTRGSSRAEMIDLRRRRRVTSPSN